MVTPAVLQQPSGAGSRRSAAAAMAVEDVVDAAMRCIANRGFERLTIDDIVRQSGIARTTIYRKVGHREAILRAVLLRVATSYHQHCALIADRPVSFFDRMEDIVIAGIVHMERYPWLGAAMRAGISHSSLALFDDVRASLPQDAVRTMLEEAMRDGYCQPDVSLDEAYHWLIRQILVIGSEPPASHAEQRRHVRAFVMPFFFPPPRPQNR